MDEVDFTILAATSVLGDLSDKCPPAEACRDAFERMSRATVSMCLSGTNPSFPPNPPAAPAQPGQNKRKRSTFDSQFRELFAGTDEVLAGGTGTGKIPKSIPGGSFR